MPFYDEFWNQTEATSRAYRVNTTSPILIWRSPEGNRHCLIPCSAGYAIRDQQLANQLSLFKHEMQFKDQPKNWYVDVQCADTDAYRLFDYFIHELEQCQDPLTSLDATIDNFRHFWSRPPKIFTDDDAVGLFGELWFLDEWLSKDVVHGFEAWTGGDPRLHDFCWSDTTLEVKATRKPLPATHRIGTLEQLMPQNGRPLFLFSLAVRQDSGAGTFLTELIDSYRAKLIPFSLSTKFDRLISKRGYRPDDLENENYRYILREGGQQFFEVRDNFPRLVGSSFAGGVLPSGVGGISYDITLAGCDEFKSSHMPGFDARDVFGEPVTT